VVDHACLSRKAALPVAVASVLVPSTTPDSPPDQSDGEIDPDETGALKLDDEVVVVSEASDSGGEDEAEEAEEAADDSVDGGSEDGDFGLDGDSELGDDEDGALDVGGHGLVDVPGVPGVPGAVEAHADGELEDGEVGGDTVTEGLAGFTGAGVLWSCLPVSPWWRPNQWPFSGL
jgi:hypothetical protein